MKTKGSPPKALFGTTLGFFFGFAAVALYGPTAVFFKDTMNLSPLLVGILVAIPALSGSLLRIPFGAWVESSGGKTPFTILLVLSAVGLGGVCLLLTLYYPNRMTVQLYPLILFFGLLSGCGIATFSVGVGQTAYWFPRRQQGRALGIFGGIANLAPGIFSLLLPIVLVQYGVVNAYYIWFVFLIIGTILYMVVGRNAYSFQLLKGGISREDAFEKAHSLGQELFPEGSAIESLKISSAQRKTWGLTFIYFTTFGGFVALTAWFPTYWSLYLGTSLIIAGVLTAVYSILTSLIRAFAGALADRIGGEQVAFYSLMILIVGSLMLTFSANLALSLIGAIVMAIGMGISNAAVFKLVPTYVPNAVGGAAGGGRWIRSVWWICHSSRYGDYR